MYIETKTFFGNVTFLEPAKHSTVFCECSGLIWVKLCPPFLYSRAQHREVIIVQVFASSRIRTRVMTCAQNPTGPLIDFETFESFKICSQCVAKYSQSHAQIFCTAHARTELEELHWKFAITKKIILRVQNSCELMAPFYVGHKTLGSLNGILMNFFVILTYLYDKSLHSGPNMLKKMENSALIILMWHIFEIFQVFVS